MALIYVGFANFGISSISFGNFKFLHHASSCGLISLQPLQKDGSLLNIMGSSESSCTILTRFNSGNDQQVAYHELNIVFKDYFRLVEYGL